MSNEQQDLTSTEEEYEEEFEIEIRTQKGS